MKLIKCTGCMMNYTYDLMDKTVSELIDAGFQFSNRIKDEGLVIGHCPLCTPTTKERRCIYCGNEGFLDIINDNYVCDRCKDDKSL